MRHRLRALRVAIKPGTAVADASAGEPSSLLRVVVHTQGESPETLEFARAHRVTFGRAEDNDIVLSPSYVSRAHGEFICEEGQWRVVDRGSISGLEVTPAEGSPHSIPSGAQEVLNGGEIIRIVDTTLHIDLKPVDDLTLAFEEELWQDTPYTVSGMTSAKLNSVASIQPSLSSNGDSEKLDLLFELTKDLNRLEELDQVLRRIGKAVFDALPRATHFCVCVPDPEGEFTPHFAITREGGEIEPERMVISKSIVKWAAEREMAVVFAADDHDDPTPESVHEHSISSCMAVPLQGARGVVGVMQVDNRLLAEAFTELDLNLMIVLASGAASALERAQFRADIHRMFEGFVEASVTAIEARDPTTSGHSRRVANYTIELARTVDQTSSGPLAGLSFTEDELRELSYAALLHDFGKVGVPECVLLKSHRLHPEQLAALLARFREIRAAYRNAYLLEALTQRRDPEEALSWVEQQMSGIGGELDRELLLVHELNQNGPSAEDAEERIRAFAQRSFIDENGRSRRFLTEDELESLCLLHGTLTHTEREAIQSHVLQSERFLEQIPWSANLERIPRIVAAHHEKLDGSGYPRGIVRDEIPPHARLLTVCDIFDALTASDRPYRSALPYERGLDMLRREAAAGKVDADCVELFIEARIWTRV